MRIHRSKALCGALCLLAAQAAGAATRPAVVELFTSEGCSSCPPAEAYLGELAERSDVLALAFHVDYWDDLGWRDQFGIPEATPRQQGYARALRSQGVYTPEMVIDGTRDFVGSNRGRIASVLRDARQGVPIDLAVREGIVVVDMGPQTVAAALDVVLVAYRRSAVSAIGRGENSGRTLTEFNIVRYIRTLGRYVGQAQEYRARVADLPVDATDLVVLAQTAGQGPIIGAVHGAIAIPR